MERWENYKRTLLLFNAKLKITGEQVVALMIVSSIITKVLLESPANFIKKNQLKIKLYESKNNFNNP